MLKMFYRSMNNDKGFTLIELIVVIAVLGILAAVALPRVTGITGKATTAADAEHLRILNEAYERSVAEDKTQTTIPNLISEGYLSPGTTSNGAAFDEDDGQFKY